MLLYSANTMCIVYHFVSRNIQTYGFICLLNNFSSGSITSCLSLIYQHIEISCTIFIFFLKLYHEHQSSPLALTINPPVTNRLSHPYDLDVSTFIFRGIGSYIFILLFAASHLWLFCLPMSHKKDARLILVKYAAILESLSCSISSLLCM